MQSSAVQWVLGGTLFPLSCLSHSSESSRHSPLNPLNVLRFALPSTDTVPLPGLTLAAWSALLSALPSLASVLPLANTQVGYSAAPPTPHHTHPHRYHRTTPTRHPAPHCTSNRTTLHPHHITDHTQPYSHTKCRYDPSSRSCSFTTLFFSSDFASNLLIFTLPAGAVGCTCVL